MNSTRGKRIPVTHLNPDADSLRNIHSSVNSETVRIAVVDEDRLFVEGICALLNQWDEFDVVGKGYSAEDALTLCSRTTPSVLLLGVCFGGEIAVDTVKRIVDQFPGTNIFILASSNEADEATACVLAGANGFGEREKLLANRLRSLVWALACGDAAFSGAMFNAFRTRVSSAQKEDKEVFLEKSEALSSREVSILALLAKGCSNSEIAQQLFLSEPTVKKEISRIIKKLDVSNRVQAAVAAAKYL